ncbi:hypothetical protein [Carboxydothermus ferrireducens]|uniref:Uncharacterized protein n=1 Tax=Carboxydothermus ferrireducens DSM 11255 TaxID=1119529 RepID=A0ABX2R899_9THEO|nr:hypothetical protein [Carboxydothermus ferrireducens]NYE57125.1 hypothetical protein [Carboxydothermus ferrireducens DSM 11255]
MKISLCLDRDIITGTVEVTDGKAIFIPDSKSKKLEEMSEIAFTYLPAEQLHKKLPPAKAIYRQGNGLVFMHSKDFSVVLSAKSQVINLHKSKIKLKGAEMNHHLIDWNYPLDVEKEAERSPHLVTFLAFGDYVRLNPEDCDPVAGYVEYLKSLHSRIFALKLKKQPYIILGLNEMPVGAFLLEEFPVNGRPRRLVIEPYSHFPATGSTVDMLKLSFYNSRNVYAGFNLIWLVPGAVGFSELLEEVIDEIAEEYGVNLIEVKPGLKSFYDLNLHELV